MSVLMPAGYLANIGIDSNGKNVRTHPDFIRLWEQGISDRLGGINAPTIPDLAAEIGAIDDRLTADEAAMLTGTYDDAHDERVLSIRNSNGADLPIDELFCWDIHYWLTRAEIADTRNQNGPTINLTTQIQFAIDSLVAKFVGPPNPAHKSASMAGTLKLHHSYLVDGLDWHPAIRLQGDNFRDTIIVQSDTPNGHLLRGLARNGQASGSRSPYAQISDMQLLGSNSLGPGNMVTRGVWLEDASADPINPLPIILGHNAVIMERVSISNFSGAGFYCPKKRHGPKLRFYYIQGCGKVLQDGNGVATTDGSGVYSPGVYCNSDSDAEFLHGGCGGNGGDSYFFQNGETYQLDGGDCWASANPDLGYYSVRATGMDYLIIQGTDINGKCYYKGNGAASPSVSSQLRVIGNNFRFRQSSFGIDDDTGMPAPLDSYFEVEDGPGAVFLGNTYTPYYAPGTGLVAARPSYIYKTTGQTVIVSYDRMMALDSNDWPAGATIGPTPALSTISNGFGTKVILCSGYLDDIKGFSILMNALQFIPGGGQYGATDGTAVPAGMVGEFAVVASSTPVAIPNAANTPMASVALQPGRYLLSGSMQAQVLTGSPNVALTRFGISTSPTTITTTTSATFAERQFNSAIVAAGNFERLDLDNVPLNISVATTVYAVGRINFGGVGTVQALAHLNIQRIG